MQHFYQSFVFKVRGQVTVNWLQRTKCYFVKGAIQRAGGKDNQLRDFLQLFLMYFWPLCACSVAEDYQCSRFTETVIITLEIIHCLRPLLLSLFRFRFYLTVVWFISIKHINALDRVKGTR
jgi:hypothetical protein